MDKKKYIILLSTLAIFIIAIITILLANNKGNGPWTGDNNKCYSSLIISFSKENQIEYITIKLIDNNSFVLSTSGNDRYYTNSAELNNYINELINTY